MRRKLLMLRSRYLGPINHLSSLPLNSFPVASLRTFFCLHLHVCTVDCAIELPFSIPAKKTLASSKS